MKTALITGANGGIGIATVKLFLENGYTVFAHYNQSKSHLEKLGSDRLTLVQADFSKSGDVKKLIPRCLEKTGRIDVLVNNAAAFSTASDFSALSEEAFDEMMAVNLKAPFLLSQQALEAMKKQKHGRIINLSSIGVKFGGSPHSAHYTISKKALEGLTECLNKAGTKFNVLTNTIRVGVTDTEMHKKNAPKNMEDRVKMIPLARMAQPEEIARAIYFLASENANYVSGTTLTVAGGE